MNLNRIYQKVTVLLNWHKINNGHNGEYYLISFPKCGRTWLRVMVKRALQLHFRVDSKDICDLMFQDVIERDFCRWKLVLPRIMVSHDDDPQWKKPRELAVSKWKYRKRKVIFLVRDPRDVVVSAYFQGSRRAFLQDIDGIPRELRKRTESYKGTLHEFIRRDFGGLETLLEFYNIWARNRHVPKGFLLVRYEDIHKNSRRELCRILNFLGLQAVDNEVIDEAVNFSSFENMRRMEEEGMHASGGILEPADRSDKESYKTRRGKVDGFVDYLDAADIEYLNKRIKESLPDFYGYKRLTADLLGKRGDFVAIKSFCCYPRV